MTKSGHVNTYFKNEFTEMFTALTGITTDVLDVKFVIIGLKVFTCNPDPSY
jgi:hypothetical protein